MATIAALTENFEGGTNGANLTVGNTIFDTINTPAPIFSNTAIEGTLSMTNANATSSVVERDFAAVTTLWYSWYYRPAANATSNTAISNAWGDANTAKVLDLQIQAGGTAPRLRSVNTAVWSGSDLALNQWHRIEVGITVGTSVQCRIFSGANLHTTTPSQNSGVQSNANTAATNVDNIRLGLATGDATLVHFFDRLRGDNATAPAAITGGGTAAAASGALTLSGFASLTAGPAVPTGLTATPVSATQINLAWNAVSGASGYDIERNGAVIVFDHPTNSYSNTGLSPATTYTYRVRSVD